MFYVICYNNYSTNKVKKLLVNIEDFSWFMEKLEQTKRFVHDEKWYKTQYVDEIILLSDMKIEDIKSDRLLHEKIKSMVENWKVWENDLHVSIYIPQKQNERNLCNG